MIIIVLIAHNMHVAYPDKSRPTINRLLSVHVIISVFCAKATKSHTRPNTANYMYII